MQIMNIHIRRESLALLLFISLGVAGLLVLWQNTEIWGIGVGYDSYFYITAADNFLAGNGFSRYGGDGTLIPLVHFPPMYPFVLAVVNLALTGDTILGARILAVAFWSINITLVGWLIFVYTESLISSTIGAVIILLSPFLLEVHLMAMTEPMFLTMLLLTLFAFSRYLQFPTNKNIVICGVLAGLSVLIRYVGLVSIISGLLIILLLRNTKFSRRFREAAYFGLTGALVVLPWLARNWLISARLTNRSFVLHVPSIEKLLDGIEIASTWISPTLIPGIFATGERAFIKLAAVIAVIGVGFLLWAVKIRRSSGGSFSHDREFQFAVILLIFSVLYLLFLLNSLTFFDASTSLNNRIMSPLYMIGVLLGIIVVWRGYAVSSSRILTLVMVAVVALFLSASNFDRYRLDLNKMHNKGIGFTGKDWQMSETISEIMDLPSHLIIYTNEPFAVYLLTDRLSFSLPEKFDPVKLEQNPEFEIRMNSMRMVFQQDQGVLVLFDSYYSHDVYAKEENLLQGLYLWQDTADGAIYFPEGISP